MVYVVNIVLVRGVDIILEKDFVHFAILKLEIHSFMIQIRILSMILQMFSPTLHNLSTNHTRASYVGTILTTSIQEDLNQQKLNDEFKIKLRNELLNTMQSLCERILQREQAANPEDSLIMGNEELSTIPEKESDEVIKSSVEDLVPIPSEFEDTSRSDSECDLPSCDDFSPINIHEEKSVTFFNPLFDSNDDFTSSDDESLSDEDIPEDNNIESKDSYISNLDEPALLVTPCFDANEDECFDPRGEIDEIDAFLDMDIILLLKNLLNDDMSFPLPLKELHFEGLNTPLDSEEFLDHDPRSLKDELDKEDLNSMVKVFDPGIQEKFFSPTYVSIPFEDRHYLSLTYVIRIFIPYFTYPVDSSLPLSLGSEDIIFDPGIYAYSFYFLEPVAYESPMEVCSSTCFVPNITMIWGESS
ncbi:hypothetical protein Tco_1279032 [Tanacetum coccineum]